MVVGNFARKDLVAFEKTHNGFGVADDLTGISFGRFLGLRVAIHIVDGVFKGGGCNIMVKSGESLFLIVGEFPDDESDANTVGEDRIKIREFIEIAVIHSGHGNAMKALKLGNGNIFEEPGRKIWTKDT